MVSSSFMSDFGIKDEVFAFEIVMDNILADTNATYKDISQFPSVRKDITLMTSENNNILKLIDKIDKSSYKYMKNIRIKDIFIDKDNLQSNNRHVTLEACLQSNKKTLSDKDISSEINKLISEIKNRFKLNIKDA